MKDSTVLIIGGGAIAYALFSGSSSGEGESSGSSQQFAGGSGQYGVPDSALAQLQNTSLPVKTKKEIINIIRTVEGSPDTRLDKIDVVNYSSGGSSRSVNYVDVTTSSGSSTKTAKKLAMSPNTVTFIKNSSGEVQGAYDSVNLISRTKKSAQTLYKNKSNPIVGISNNVSSSRNYTPVSTKKDTKKKSSSSFFSRWF